jgi:hypothetical protein
MKKYIIVAGLIISFCLCFWIFNSFIRAQEETVTLENTFGNVTFTHKQHTGLTSCQECHHPGLDTPKCSSCHTKESEVNPMNAFHKNCIDCHKDKQTGPTACADCHKK